MLTLILLISSLVFLSLSILIIIKQRRLITFLTSNFLHIDNYIKDLKEVIEDFNQHLNKFNSMEVYKGEPVVEDLVKHSEHVLNRIEVINNSLEKIE